MCAVAVCGVARRRLLRLLTACGQARSSSVSSSNGGGAPRYGSCETPANSSATSTTTGAGEIETRRRSEDFAASSASSGSAYGSARRELPLRVREALKADAAGPTVVDTGRSRTCTAGSCDTDCAA